VHLHSIEVQAHFSQLQVGQEQIFSFYILMFLFCVHDAFVAIIIKNVVFNNYLTSLIFFNSFGLIPAVFARIAFKPDTTQSLRAELHCVSSDNINISKKLEKCNYVFTTVSCSSPLTVVFV